MALASGAGAQTQRERPVEDRAETPRDIGSEVEHRNAVAFGFLYTHAFLKPRQSADGEQLDENEDLFGFNLAYERVLIPGHLALGIAKPFLFNRERYDSPLDIVVKALIRRGRWELFFGLGLHNNLRVFSREREEQEGRRLEYAVGVISGIGVTFAFTAHWRLELELEYVHVFNARSVSNEELSPSITALYFFERGQRSH